MNTHFANLNWPQRIQIIKTFNINDEQAVKVMGVSIDKLKQARTQYVPDVTFNATPFASHFLVEPQSVQSTSNTIAPRKKRGRKTTKIQDAIAAVTTSKQPLDSFCVTHSVSEHCMRQHTRFAPERPDIVVRKDKDTGKVMIWSNPESLTE